MIVHRITSDDPAQRVAAAAGLAREAGIEQLVIDSPMARGFFDFQDFPPRRTRVPAPYHDGARVPLDTALELLSVMVRREGPWCRLHGRDGFFLHVGEEGEVYVGSARPLGTTTAERVDRSPYDPALDETDDLPPADDTFWTRLHDLLREHGSLLLEEEYVAHARHWHRLTTPDDLAATRAGLTPRARLAVWPDLSEDIDSVRAAVRTGGPLALLVQQNPDGTFDPVRVAEPWMGRTDSTHARIPAGPGRRAGLVPLDRDARRPLLNAVLPDPDGVVRARRRTNRTPADARRARLVSLRAGDVVTGTVASGLHDVGVHVDLDGEWGEGLGFLRVPEMSWEHFDTVEDVAPVGRRIRAEILHVDLGWERVNLSVKALRPDPWLEFARTRAGHRIRGTVTKVVPFGVFVRIAPGMEGLLPAVELPVGDEVTVTVDDLDLTRRRISLRAAPDA
jgi:small subunit ribosomal protein S1